MFNKIKQVINYIFNRPKINEVESIKHLLTTIEYEIFLKMDPYDKVHCLGVFNKVKADTLLKKDKLYIKLALLHDCGKENIGLFRRVKKVIVKDKLVEIHPKLGYEKLKKVNFKLAKLVLNHHNKDVGSKLKRFQKIDDES